MHAYLIQSSKFTSQKSADTLEVKPENSIGIEEVRQIQHFLARKPTQSEFNTVVVYRAHLLTIPAQNALLKTLEEPPGQAQIYLITDYPDQLLPTVLSRVQVEPKTQNLAPSSTDLAKAKKLFAGLLTAGAGERIKIIEDQKFTRESALELINSLEHVLHQDLNTNLNYSLLVQTRKYLKANCNVRLTMNNFVLNLSS